MDKPRKDYIQSSLDPERQTPLLIKGAEETPALARADKKPKEGIKTEDKGHLKLKVVGQGSSVVQFKIKRQTPPSKLMKAYTPAQLELGDEDTTDVFWQRTGGVYRKANLPLTLEVFHRPRAHS
ncbi:small ubiquitin-related modifier 2-like [Meriones unguiculatus]|uniref:small ubiquitin-related modifier 2-like n=1 Tax=Meriones unguiculatus TaxID=10047 RepID=UPI00293F3EAD|nr:small ubiquitin-related modifier 2-like [Meriones unguiculatus]